MNPKKLIVTPLLHVMDANARRLARRSFDADYKVAARFLKAHPLPDITDADKRAIDEYWRQYGIKFPDYTWYRMYYSITGMHDPRFIPDAIAFSAMFKYYNDSSCIPGWDDKNMYDKLVPGIKFPTVLAHIYRGGIYDKDWNYCGGKDLDRLCDSIGNTIGDDGCIVVKASRASQAGKGVKLVETASPASIKAALEQNRHTDYVVQRRIRQNSFMSQFCSTSVNIFRIITWRHEDKVDVLSASIRFGIEGAFTDVAYVDGEEIVNVVGVEMDGTVKDLFASFRGLTEHQVQLTQHVAPNFAAVLEMAREGHKSLHPFGIVGWDITLDQDDCPVCIEYNIYRPGMVLYQYANGPFAGDKTEQLLGFLHDKKLLEKYIPKKYRI